MVGLAFLKSIYQKHMCNDFFGCRFICAMLYTKRSRIEGNMMTTSPEKSGHTMLQYQLNLDKFYTQIIMCVHLYIYICTCGFLFPKTYFFWHGYTTNMSPISDQPLTILAFCRDLGMVTWWPKHCCIKSTRIGGCGGWEGKSGANHRGIDTLNP